jgi:hypothetical protein
MFFEGFGEIYFLKNSLMYQFFYFILHKIFVLSLSYLEMKSDELFANAELYKNFG